MIEKKINRGEKLKKAATKKKDQMKFDNCLFEVIFGFFFSNDPKNSVPFKWMLVLRKVIL